MDTRADSAAAAGQLPQPPVALDVAPHAPATHAPSSEGVHSKSGEPPPLDIETVMSALGGGVLGRYQLTVLALLLAPIAGSAIYNLQYVFNAAYTEHRCLVPECEGPSSDFTPGAWGAWALPPGAPCQRYRPRPGAQCTPDSFTNHSDSCTELVYENDYTIVSTFELGCREWRRALVGTVHVLGLLCALPAAGYCSDRWGRRRVLLTAATGVGAAGLARSFTHSYHWYLALEFIDSALGSGVYTTGYILALELVAARWRVAGGNLLAMVFALGQVVCAGVAWALPQWRALTRLLYAPALLTPLLAPLLPESVRWLLTRGRLPQARALLLTAARVNRRQLSPHITDMLSNTNVTEAGTGTGMGADVVPWVAVLRSGVLALRLAQCCWWWAVTALVYYGLSINAVSLGEPHLSFALSALCELPGYALSLLVLDRCGRRRSIAAAYAACALLLLAFPAVPPTLPWAHTALSLAGKLCISMAFSSIYIYCAELFPTAARHRMLAVCSMAGRVSSLLAPLSPLLGAVLPYALFGALALSAAALMLLAPDTSGRPLPDTLTQAEELHT